MIVSIKTRIPPRHEHGGQLQTKSADNRQLGRRHLGHKMHLPVAKWFLNFHSNITTKNGEDFDLDFDFSRSFFGSLRRCSASALKISFSRQLYVHFVFRSSKCISFVMCENWRSGKCMQPAAYHALFSVRSVCIFCVLDSSWKAFNLVKMVKNSNLIWFWWDSLKWNFLKHVSIRKKVSTKQ